MARQGAVMKAQQAREFPGQGIQPQCAGVSRLDEPCSSSATVFCDRCERWFCAEHAQDDEWHACAHEHGELDDIGGEG